MEHLLYLLSNMAKWTSIPVFVFEMDWRAEVDSLEGSPDLLWGRGRLFRFGDQGSSASLRVRPKSGGCLKLSKACQGPRTVGVSLPILRLSVYGHTARHQWLPHFPLRT